MTIEPSEDVSPVQDDSLLPIELSPAEHAQREARFAVIDHIQARSAHVPESEVLEDISAAIAAVRAARRNTDNTPASTTPTPSTPAPC